ncbi:MAG: HAD family phosphatase [Bryobacteraceae bacterium]
MFDLDGVLILSRDAHRRAFEEVFAPFGAFRFDYDRYAGWRTREVIRAVFSEMAHPPAEDIISQCAVRKSALARQFLAQNDPVPADCVPVIQRLSLRYSLALASSGSRESVGGFLDRTGLHGSFRSVLSGDDVEAAKPDPEIFSRSILALGLEPESCIVIEDAVAGIQAALLAGAKAIGMGDERALTEVGADCVVSSLTELEQLLEASCHSS